MGVPGMIKKFLNSININYSLHKRLSPAYFLAFFAIV